jgi:hypothetical protein
MTLATKLQMKQKWVFSDAKRLSVILYCIHEFEIKI